MTQPGSPPQPGVVSLAAAIIEHPTLGLLLQLRDEHAPNFPLHWSLFGGHMEADEDPDFALWRELDEDLQLTQQMVKSWRLAWNLPHHSGGRVYIYHVITEATLDNLVLGEGKAMHFANALDLDPPQPYRGHYFTAYSSRVLRDYLSTQMNGQS